jgi:hypothetical protein
MKAETKKCRRCGRALRSGSAGGSAATIHLTCLGDEVRDRFAAERAAKEAK